MTDSGFSVLDDLPEGVRQGNENLVLITPPAKTKLEQLMSSEGSGSFLRVAVKGGGCNGLSYKTKIDHMPKKGDIVVLSLGVSLLIDSRSALYLKGTEIDYSNAMIGGGFAFSNPNAASSCSCGESFNV